MKTAWIVWEFSGQIPPNFVTEKPDYRYYYKVQRIVYTEEEE